MIYSAKGLALTESFEGCRLVAYQDSVGVWTIGYGHTRDVAAGMTCTVQQAATWLEWDIAIAAAFVNQYVTATLTQGEFDALVDFAFNLGVGAEQHSSLLRFVQAGNFELARMEFPRWDLAGGHPVAGLFRRRMAEAAEFDSPAAA